MTPPASRMFIAEKSVPVSLAQTETGDKANAPVIEGKIDQVFVGNEGASHATGVMAREWTRHRIRIFDIKEIVSRAAKLAETGHGSFRFIEEPQEYFAPNGLFDLLAGLSGRVPLRECRNIYPVWYSRLAEFYGNDAKGSRTRDTGGKSRLQAISCPQGQSPRILPDFISITGCIALSEKRLSLRTGKTDWLSPETHRAILAVIRAFSRKSRPLILIFRGGESITRGLHDLLTVLAGSVDDTPIAVFVFFGRMRVESWHTLSRLTGTTEAPHG